ncbi:unnamed protein product [Discula destructiva]
MSIRQNHPSSTVYFTPKEIDRIRTVITTTLQNAEHLRGSPRQPRVGVPAAIRQATAASLAADMAASASLLSPDAGTGGGRDTLPILTVGQPYPPCSIPTHKLQPMSLTDLRAETHHRGRKLVLNRASPVVRLAARSWAMMRDECGEAGVMERLEVCLHARDQSGRDVLEGATRLVVREPYFTVTEKGEATLRVDHPSDLAAADDEDLASPEAGLGRGVEGDSDTAEDTAMIAVTEARRCKEAGNAALTARDFPRAHSHYSKGLQHTQQQHNSSNFSSKGSLLEMTRDLHRNRAHVNLLLSHLDEAKADALASIITGASDAGSDATSQVLNSKAYYRAGCAAYNLGAYEDARDFFAKRAGGGDDAVLRRIELRIRERDTGLYQWVKLRAGLVRSREIDAASFVGKTRVGDSPGRGRGLFAVCDIPAEEVVMCEKAFCVAWEGLTAVTYDVRDERIRISPVGLVKAAVEKVSGTPSYTERVVDLHGDYRGEADLEDAQSKETAPTLDVFRIHDIVSRNAFGFSFSTGNLVKSQGDAMTAGLWLHGARINHSCVPNTKKEFLGDMMLVRAKRHIAAGEELLHSYIDETSSYDSRQESLMRTWGFECECSLCKKQQGR